MSTVRVDSGVIRYVRWVVSSALSFGIWFVSAPLLSELVRFIFEILHSAFIGEAGLFAKVSYYISFMNWLQEKAYNYGGWVASGLTFYLMQKYGNFIDNLLIMFAKRFDIEVVLPAQQEINAHGPAPAPAASLSEPALSTHEPVQGTQLHSISAPSTPLSSRPPFVQPLSGLKPAAIRSPEVTPRQRAATINGATNGMPNGVVHNPSPRAAADSPRKDARPIPLESQAPSPRGRSISASVPMMPAHLVGNLGRSGSPAADLNRAPDAQRKHFTNSGTEAAMHPAVAPVLVDRHRATSSSVLNGASTSTSLSSASATRGLDALVDMPPRPTPASVLASSLTSPRPRPGSGSFTPMSTAAAVAASPPALARTTSDRYIGRSPNSSAGSLVERGSQPISPRPGGNGK